MADVESNLRRLEGQVNVSLQTGQDANKRRQAKNKLVGCRQQIDKLQSALSVYQSNPRNHGLMDRDAALFASRLDASLALFRKIDEMCNRTTSSAGMNGGVSQDYYNQKRINEETEETKALNNQQMYEDQRMKMDRDDEVLDRINVGLGNLHQVGLEQQKQFKRQEGLLMDLHDGMDKTERNMNTNIQRVNKVEEGTRGGCCALLTMIVLLGLIVSLLASNWACAILPKTTKCK